MNHDNKILKKANRRDDFDSTEDDPSHPHSKKHKSNSHEKRSSSTDGRTSPTCYGCGRKHSGESFLKRTSIIRQSHGRIQTLGNGS